MNDDTVTLALFLACTFDKDEIENRARELASGKWDHEFEAFKALTEIYEPDKVGNLLSELCTGERALKS